MLEVDRYDCAERALEDDRNAIVVVVDARRLVTWVAARPLMVPLRQSKKYAAMANRRLDGGIVL